MTLFFYTQDGVTKQIQGDRDQTVRQAGSYLLSHDSISGAISYTAPFAITRIVDIQILFEFDIRTREGQVSAVPSSRGVVLGTQFSYDFDTDYTDNRGTLIYRIYWDDCRYKIWEGSYLKLDIPCPDSHQSLDGCSSCCRELLSLVKAIKV